MIRRLLFVILALPAMLLGTGIAEYNRAWMLWNDGRRAEAIEAAKAIIASDPTYYRAYNLIAEVAVEERESEMARAYFRELARADAANPWSFYGLGRLEEHLGNGTGALSYFGDCIKRSGDAWPCYGQFGSESKTERNLVRGLPPNAGRVYVLLARASFYNRQRRFAEFRRTALEGLELARRQNRTELQAFLQELLGSGHAPVLAEHLEGLAYHEEAYRIFAAADDWESQKRAVLAIIGTLTELKQFSAAQERIDKFRTDARAHFGASSQAELAVPPASGSGPGMSMAPSRC
jgi:tetratricopeptide (TPR) repeat protein